MCGFTALYALAIAINLAIFIYGFDYYKLSAIDRPFSPKHHLLRPSGPVGLYLGFFGVALFVGIFLYPIRKHWPWLASIGSTRHWLDIHILMGLTAPAIVAFHSTLKFKGIGGHGVSGSCLLSRPAEWWGAISTGRFRAR